MVQMEKKNGHKIVFQNCFLIWTATGNIYIHRKVCISIESFCHFLQCAFVFNFMNAMTLCNACLLILMCSTAKRTFTSHGSMMAIINDTHEGLVGQCVTLTANKCLLKTMRRPRSGPQTSRMRLADICSTILLPPGFRRLLGFAQKVQADIWAAAKAVPR